MLSGAAANANAISPLRRRAGARCFATPPPEAELPCFDAVDSLGFEACCCSSSRPGATLIHSRFGQVSVESCSAASGPTGFGRIAAGTRNALAQGQTRFEASKEVPPQELIEVHSDCVTCVLGMNPNHYTLNGTNCWLVGTGKRRLLIDTGENDKKEEFLENLKDAMAQVGCEGLCGIVITHMHGDHTGGIDTLQEAFGPGIPIMKGAVPKHHVAAMENIMEQGVLEHVQGRARPRDPTWGGSDPTEWDSEARTRDEMKRDFGSIQMNYNNHRKMVDEWQYQELVDDEVVTMAEGATLRVMITPGHASDHVALWLDEEDAIFTGDHVLGYGTTSVMDMSSYMTSIYRMRAQRPDKLYPGHGPYVKEGIELLNRYILHRTSREKQVIEVLMGAPETALTTRELVDRLYTDMNSEKLRMAQENILKIAMKLGKEGKARPLRLSPALDYSTANVLSGGATAREPAQMAVASGLATDAIWHTEEGVWAPYEIPGYMYLTSQLPSTIRWTLGDLSQDADHENPPPFSEPVAAAPTAAAPTAAAPTAKL